MNACEPCAVRDVQTVITVFANVTKSIPKELHPQILILKIRPTELFLYRLSRIAFLEDPDGRLFATMGASFAPADDFL